MHGREAADPVCEVHQLQNNELLAAVMLGLQKIGGIDVCADCVTRAKESARKLQETEEKPEPWIVKIQRPFPANIEGELYLYNESRSIETFVPVKHEYFAHLRKLMGEEMKVFAYAVLTRNSMLEINELAPWQEW